MKVMQGEVHIPKAVDVEMMYLDPAWRTQRPTWVMVETLVEPFAAEAIAWQQAGLLDPGEAEALALARQLQADWLLTDDAAARLVVQVQGLEVHGSKKSGSRKRIFLHSKTCEHCDL